jgi:hypothetical protein
MSMKNLNDTIGNRNRDLMACSAMPQPTPFLLSCDICRQQQTYVKPEAAITVFELLMMSGVSLETC